MPGGKPRRVISYEKDVFEYIPASRNRSFAKTLTESSQDADDRPLDEIALLKRGFLEKNSYHRKMRKEPEPISLQELLSRGIQLQDGQLPMQSSMSSISFQSTQIEASSVVSDVSSIISEEVGELKEAFLEKPINEAVYDVGLPEEKATLKMGDTKKGKRYELKTGDGFQAVLDSSPNCKVLLAFRD